VILLKNFHRTVPARRDKGAFKQDFQLVRTLPYGRGSDFDAFEYAFEYAAMYGSTCRGGCVKIVATRTAT